MRWRRPTPQRPPTRAHVVTYIERFSTGHATLGLRQNRPKNAISDGCATHRRISRRGTLRGFVGTTLRDNGEPPTRRSLTPPRGVPFCRPAFSLSASSRDRLMF